MEATTILTQGGGKIEAVERVETSVQLERTAADTIVETEDNLGEYPTTYVISDNSISVNIYYSSGNKDDDNPRFVSVGDALVGEEVIALLLDVQYGECVFFEHLNNLELGSATGSFSLATGVYDDVLHIRCSLTEVASTDLYLAKGKGIILGSYNSSISSTTYMIPQLAETGVGADGAVADSELQNEQ